MSRYEIGYTWTFQEVLTAYLGEEITPWNNVYDVAEIFASDFPQAPLWESTDVAKDFLNDLFDLIHARFYESNFAETESSSLDTPYSSYFIQFINIMAATYDRYAAMLIPFSNIKADLLSQVSSSTETGYNDTPQEEGTYTDETHRTSYTKVTSLTDGATPAERLAEINQKIRNIMLDWSNEFKKLFWED